MIEFGSGLVDESLELTVETNLPAKDAKNESCGEVTIGKRERVNCRLAKKVIGISFTALDSQQNVEGGLARKRDSGHGAQPKRASAGNGFPRRNSSVVMRFLPSS